MIKTLTVLGILGLMSLPPGFLEEQKKYARVRTAITEKDALIEKELKAVGLSTGNVHVLFTAYKDSDVLELYVKGVKETTFKRLKTFSICARSGALGPKRKQGDGQVPEGFYHIDRYNPSSSFYLSLGVNYPNLADKRKSTHSNLGGDIFIHGNCVTIGCLPMTDDVIKEIYLYGVYARNNGQMKVPVYIFPFKMTSSNWATYKEKYKGDQAIIDFWSNLKAGYDLFEKEKKELKFSVNVEGDYTF